MSRSMLAAKTIPLMSTSPHLCPCFKEVKVDRAISNEAQTEGCSPTSPLRKRPFKLKYTGEKGKAKHRKAVPGITFVSQRKDLILEIKNVQAQDHEKYQ